MKWVLVFGFGIAAYVNGNAQSFHLPVKSADLSSGAYSRFGNAFSFEMNPAVLGSDTSFQAGISCERRWMLKELDYYRMVCSFPAGQAGMGISFHYTGNSDYNESALGIAYGKNLGRIELGVQFRYDVYHASGYSNYPFGSAGVGLRFHPTEKIYTGIAFDISLFGGVGKENPEKGAGNYRMGFGYEASSQVFISIQWIKEAGLPLNINGSIDYRFADQFYASFGIESISTSPYIKSGWKKNRLTVEIFTAYHLALGFTPGLVLLWEGKKKAG